MGIRRIERWAADHNRCLRIVKLFESFVYEDHSTIERFNKNDGPCVFHEGRQLCFSFCNFPLGCPLGSHVAGLD